jgi:integrase
LSVERGIITVTPFAGIKPPALERARDRVLDHDDIRVAWCAFETVGWPFGDIAKLLLLTGMRRDEVAEARWTEIDLVDKTWTVAKERSKNGVAHEIPLSDAAIGIVQGLPHIGEKKDGFIFTTMGGRRYPVSVAQRRQSTRRCLPSCGQRTNMRKHPRDGFSTTSEEQPRAAWPA